MHFKLISTILFGIVIVSCGKMPVKSQSSLRSDTTREVNVVIDASETFLSRSVADVTMFIKYADSDDMGKLTFTRSNILYGTFAKSFALRSDVELSSCKSQWIYDDVAPGGSPGDTMTPFIMPKAPEDGSFPFYDCEWSEDRQTIFLRLPFVFEKASIIFTSEAFTSRAAKNVIGTFGFAEGRKIVTTITGPNQNPTPKKVFVLAPKPLKLQLNLRWGKIDGSTEQEALVFSVPQIKI